MFKGFFSGISITGYLIGGLLTAFLLSSTVNLFLLDSLGDTKKELGLAEAAVEVMATVLVDNQLALNQLHVEHEACVSLRKGADDRAVLLIQRLSKELLSVARGTDSRVNEIERIVEQSGSAADCGDVPDRATELLIEAAHSANRDKDSN